MFSGSPLQPAPDYAAAPFEIIGKEIVSGVDGNLSPRYPYGSMSSWSNFSQPASSYITLPSEGNNHVPQFIESSATYLSNHARITVATRPTSRRRSATTSQPRVTCSHPDCHKSYARPSDLRRHALTHRPSAPKYDCPVQGCHRRGANGFLRADKCREHYRAIHEA